MSLMEDIKIVNMYEKSLAEYGTNEVDLHELQKFLREHYDYASLYLNKGEFDKAQEHLESSLSITKERLGEEHPEYYGRLIRLAHCYYEQQNYSTAEEKLKDILKTKGW